jgi:hypothetical protein
LVAAHGKEDKVYVKAAAFAPSMSINKHVFVLAKGGALYAASIF